MRIPRDLPLVVTGEYMRKIKVGFLYYFQVDEENCQQNGTRVYASGEVYIGNTLTKTEFRRLTQLQDEVGIHMILRQRPGIELQYTEAFIRSQYEAWAYFENLRDEQKKVKTRTRARASTRGTYWPAAPLLTERPVWCRPLTKRAGQWDVYLQDVDNLGHVAPVHFFRKVLFHTEIKATII